MTKWVSILIGANVGVWILQQFFPWITQAFWLVPAHVLQAPWTLITYMFLHDPNGFAHLGFNMLALYIFGPRLETVLGGSRFITLYLLAGLGGSVGSYLLGPHGELGIGASGAIMGVLGAYLVVGVRRRLPVQPVAILLVINLVIGFWGNVDWRAHLGGLAVGAVLGLLYDYAGDLRDTKTGLVLTVGGSVAMLALLALLITSIAPGHFNLN